MILIILICASVRVCECVNVSMLCVSLCVCTAQSISHACIDTLCKSTLLQLRTTSSLKVLDGNMKGVEGKQRRLARTRFMCIVCCLLSMLVCVAMKRHGDDNEDKQPDKRPRLHQVTSYTTHLHSLSIYEPNTTSLANSPRRLYRLL